MRRAALVSAVAVGLMLAASLGADSGVAAKKLIAEGGYWYSVGQFDKAMKSADEALKLEPENPAARQLKGMVAEVQARRAARPAATEGEIEREAIVVRAERDMAVPREVLRKPDNWAEVKERTGGVSGEAVEATAENRAIDQALDSAKVTVDFNQASLKDAAAYLATAGKVNIVVDARAKVGDRAAPDAEITFKAENIKLRNAVNWLARLNNLGWTVRDQVVFITDAEHMEEMKVTAVYDIRDIVEPVYDYPSVPDFDMTLPAVNARRISDGFYRVPDWWQWNGRGVFTGAYFADFTAQPRQMMTEDEVRQLIDDLIAAQDKK